MIGIMADFGMALPNAGETLQVEPRKLEGAADRVSMVCRTSKLSCSSGRDVGRLAWSAHPLVKHRRVIRLILVLSGISCIQCWAASPIPGEIQTGFIYTITHLHPAAYFILFFIFLVSLANLAARGWIPIQFNWSLRVFDFLGKFEKTVLSTVKVQEFKRKKRRAPSSGPPEGMKFRDVDSSVIGVRKRSNTNLHRRGPVVPTPFEGINHPMPHFVRNTQRPVVHKPGKSQQTVTGQFKPYPITDPVYQGESEPRVQGQLVVSGTITDSQGSGLGSVIVYLTDEAGNRHGQSCRSRPGSGDFWVFANRPGKYLLHAYKRGYVVQYPEDLTLTIKDGRIDGFNLRMVAEECTVHGRVFNISYGSPASNVEVRCVCKSSSRSSYCRTDESGEYRLMGVPLNSECELEVWGANNTVLARSEFFETAANGEIQRDIIIPGSLEEEPVGGESFAWEQGNATE
jgi:hypothetical protein